MSSSGYLTRREAFQEGFWDAATDMPLASPGMSGWTEASTGSIRPEYYKDYVRGYKFAKSMVTAIDFGSDL